MWDGVRYYLGLDAGTVQGRRFAPAGCRMFNRCYGPSSKYLPGEVPGVVGMCDSGAFQEIADADRTSPAAALDGQLAWERRASEKWEREFRFEAVVSYDRLVDEQIVGGRKVKLRWDLKAAEVAVGDTIAGAAYLHSQRDRVAPRLLVQSCQGVDAVQYQECAAEVLKSCRPADVFGLGGWCILGKRKKLLPSFWAAIHRVLPMVAAAGLARVHIFGVMWLPPLGGLLWLADQYGLAVSTDSQRAASDCTWSSEVGPAKAGRAKPTWEANVEWWRQRLAALRSSPYYRRPPAVAAHRQPDLFTGVS